MRKLEQLVGQAVSDVLERGDDSSECESPRSLVFFGNWQDPCPRDLILDPDLTPLAIVLWQLIRIHADPGKPLLFPSYDFLMSKLGVARGTVANAIKLLRLTRWLFLCARVRDKGRFRGQVFALSDRPVPVGDVLRWDNDFLEFVAACRRHRQPQVATIAGSLFQSLEAEAIQGSTVDDQVQNHRGGKIELGGQVQNLNSVSLYTSYCSNSSSKGKGKKSASDFSFPSPLDLPPAQRHLIELRLNNLDAERAQEVLDEAAGRIRLKQKTRDPVRSQFDYLTGLIRREKDGDFVFSDAGESIRKDRYDAELAQWAKDRAIATMDKRRVRRMNNSSASNSDRSAKICRVSKKR